MDCVTLLQIVLDLCEETVQDRVGVHAVGGDHGAGEQVCHHFLGNLQAQCGGKRHKGRNLMADVCHAASLVTFVFTCLSRDTYAPAIRGSS